jgi:hypothetical protein
MPTFDLFLLSAAVQKASQLQNLYDLELRLAAKDSCQQVRACVLKDPTRLAWVFYKKASTLLVSSH